MHMRGCRGDRHGTAGPSYRPVVDQPRPHSSDRGDAIDQSLQLGDAIVLASQRGNAIKRRPRHHSPAAPFAKGMMPRGGANRAAATVLALATLVLCCASSACGRMLFDDMIPYTLPADVEDSATFQPRAAGVALSSDEGYLGRSQIPLVAGAVFRPREFTTTPFASGCAYAKVHTKDGTAVSNENSMGTAGSGASPAQPLPACPRDEGAEVSHEMQGQRRACVMVAFCHQQGGAVAYGGERG